MNSTKRLRNLTTRADASWAKNYPLRIDKKEASLLNPIREKIRKTIGQVAKAHGIANVVDASAVVFGGKDLTEEVIAAVAQGK